MKYRQGSFGRVYVLKFEDGDDIIDEMKKMASKEKIRVGTVMLLGGMRAAGIVSGPKEAVIPPEPLWLNFNDGREVLGIGTLFWKNDEPIIHVHGAFGREKESFTGCIRKDSSVYLVIEAVITEILGVEAHKAVDEKTGLVMLKL